MRIEEKLWQDHSQALLAYLIAKTRNADLAQEILQDTLVKAYEARDTLKDLSKFKSWLFTIARNKLNDSFRYHSRFETFDELVHDQAFDEPLEREANIGQCLASLANNLPDIYREAVVLSDLERQKQKDVAERLQLSLPATKSRVQRGRKLLKDAIFSCCPLNFNAAGTPVSCQSAGCNTH